MLNVLLLALAVSAPGSRKSLSKNDFLPMPDPPVVACQPQKPLAEVPEQANVRMMNTGRGMGGIDVSHYQGYIQWSQVARDPQAGYVYIKATESATWVDDTYRRNLTEARRAGLKVGAYHFFSPSTPPMEQFENMVSVVKGAEQDLIPMIDVEKVGRGGSANLCSRLRTFLRAVENHYGVRPIIYTGYNFYRKHLAGKFRDYRFMIASYAEEMPDFDAIDAPVLMWQYSATGQVSGIRGNCDCSAFLAGHSLKEILMNK